MKKSVVALLICVFIAGVFFGIWLDWSVWKKTAGVRKIAFELENYQTANLRVHTGDTIYLVARWEATRTAPRCNSSGIARAMAG